ncbi:unnamed protein product [Trifolium pratense]|uniref:Uncharacterized protein n=1 Tax=Trifolium pratense TaxID=57577 RepID=A0ACB0JGW7_TRIPR|nr:unnamed protein product [Trifolium pratense]
MGSSFIQIDSISIDLANPIDKRDAGKCEHFSIREYVAEVRKKDWKLCWPFPVDESDKQPSLPPLDVPKHICCRYPNSQQENAAKDIPKDNQIDITCHSTGGRSDTKCSNAALKPCIRKDPISDIIVRRDIDLNTNLSSVDGCLPVSIEKENKVGVGLSSRLDLENGLEDNLNHQVTSVLSPKIYPDIAQEVSTTKRGSESNGVSYVQLANNLKCTDKNSAEICNGGTPSADNQCTKDLATTAMEADNKYDHTSGPPTESFDFTDNMVEDDFDDNHSEKSTSLSRRRPRKVRLMTDLLRENGELKAGKIAVQESTSHGTSNTSAASQARSIFPGNIQGDLTLTNMGLSRKRKIIPDEVRSTASMRFQRAGVEAQNLEGIAKTTDTVFNKRSNSKDVLAGTGLQVAEKGIWSKSEPERSHIVGKKKNKKNQVVDNYLIPEQQGQRRQNEDTMYTTDKAYASKTVSSSLTPVFTRKGMDNFPFYTPRIENEFNSYKEKGKMLQNDEELNSFSCHRNDLLVRDSFAYSGVKIRSSVHADVPIPSDQGMMNGKGLEEGLHLSLNSYMSDHGYNKKCIHQIENRLPFSLPFQESTSRVPQFNRKDSETNVFGGPSIPSRHTTNTISGKEVHCKEITGARNTGKTVEAVEQLGIKKRYNERASEVSEQGTLDDIPMEIVELMAKNQYERCLPDVENRCSMFEKSSISRNTQMTAGTAVYGKGKMSLLKEGQKEKSRGRPRKNNTVTRGENVKPNKRKPNHYFSPFDGSSLGVNNPYPPQPSFGFEVPQSQKKQSNGFQFSPMIANQLGGARNIKFNGSLEERVSSNASLQPLGGCSLHKNILQQDNEASRIWASLPPNHSSLGYDVSQKIVSQPSSSNMNISSPRSGAAHKQNMRRDFDLNYTNINATGQEKHSRITGPGVFNRVNGEYPFPCKHNGMEPHQNLRGSLDLYSNETIPAMHLLSLMDAGMQSRTPFNVGGSAQMLKRPSYPSDCNTKLEIGASKTNGTLKRQPSDYYNRSYLPDKSHGCFIGSQTFDASSSAQHSNKFKKDAGSNGQNSTKFGQKENMKSSNSSLQNRFVKQCSLSNSETDTSLQRRLEVHGIHTSMPPVKITSGISCTVNRNPAEFTVPETGNVYMIRGEDLKFEKSCPKNKHRFPIPCAQKQQSNLKGMKMKEHSKH